MYKEKTSSERQFALKRGVKKKLFHKSYLIFGGVHTIDQINMVPTNHNDRNGLGELK